MGFYDWVTRSFTIRCCSISASERDSLVVAAAQQGYSVRRPDALEQSLHGLSGEPSVTLIAPSNAGYILASADPNDRRPTQRASITVLIIQTGPNGRISASIRWIGGSLALISPLLVLPLCILGFNLLTNPNALGQRPGRTVLFLGLWGLLWVSGIILVLGRLIRSIRSVRRLSRLLKGG